MTARQNLHVDQGATWSFTHTVRDAAGAAVDLTGYTARMSVLRFLGSAVDAYLSTGSDADGGTITLGGAAGTVVLAMTDEDTTTLGGISSVEDRMWGDAGCEREPTIEFVYDLELISGAGVVSRPIAGHLIVSRGVTG